MVIENIVFKTNILWKTGSSYIYFLSKFTANESKFIYGGKGAYPI